MGGLFTLDLSDSEFQAFSDLVYRKAGISLHVGKKELVRARLAGRIREGGFTDFGTYYRYILSDETGDELIHLLDAISTNLTNFFRENNHFKFMVDQILPQIRGRSGPNIWSAGCSTGEEPYSIIISITENFPDLMERGARITATDLSSRALAMAERGAYPAERVDNLSFNILRKYFQKGKGDWAGWYRVKAVYRDMVNFKRLNLIEPFSFRQPLDLIFCRNVMIYFDKKTQAELIRRFYQLLRDGGYLFIGHSESLTGVSNQFKYVQPTIYRK